jgi:hypothetical protein
MFRGSSGGDRYPVCENEAHGQRRDCNAEAFKPNHHPVNSLAALQVRDETRQYTGQVDPRRFSLIGKFPEAIHRGP